MYISRIIKVKASQQTVTVCRRMKGVLTGGSESPECCRNVFKAGWSPTRLRYDFCILYRINVGRVILIQKVKFVITSIFKDLRILPHVTSQINTPWGHIPDK